MLKSFKTEINPTMKQKEIINQTIGTCRYVYNLYLAHNKERYEQEESFMSGKSFSVWLNNEYIPSHPEKQWIKEVSSKSVKKAIEDGNKAFIRFFKNESSYPKFKKKNQSDVKMYFVKNNPKDCLCERHRIKIPTLGWLRLKEKGYILTSKDGYRIKSGTVSKKAGRYYVSVVIDVEEESKICYQANEGMGIDLGIKDFAVLSDGRKFKNINKTARIRKLEKKIKREQRKLSRKYENKKKGGATQGRNIQKQKHKVQKLHHRIERIRTDYVNKVISEIVKAKPSHITIEDLNVTGMMKNRHLSKSIGDQKFYEFKSKLKRKCDLKGIEMREVDRFYPSSKMCHRCKRIKKNLKLSDRIYRCECGYIEDRDLNASKNLRDARTYMLA